MAKMNLDTATDLRNARLEGDSIQDLSTTYDISESYCRKILANGVLVDKNYRPIPSYTLGKKAEFILWLHGQGKTQTQIAEIIGDLTPQQVTASAIGWHLRKHLEQKETQ